MVALLDIPAEMFVVRLRVALTHTDLAAVQLVREVSPVLLAVAEQLGLQAEAVLTAWPDCERTELQTLLFSSPPAVSHSVTEPGPGHTASALGTGEEVAARRLLSPPSITVKHGRHFPLLH